MMGSYRYESPKTERKTISRTPIWRTSTFNPGSNQYAMGRIKREPRTDVLVAKNQNFLSNIDPLKYNFKTLSCSAPTPEKARVIAHSIKRHIIQAREAVKRTPNFVKRTYSKIIYLHNYNRRVVESCYVYPLDNILKELLVKYIELEMSILKNPDYDTTMYRLTLEMRIMKLLSCIYSTYCVCFRGRFDAKETWQFILELFEEVPYNIHEFFEDIRQKVIKKIDVSPPDPQPIRLDPISVNTERTSYEELDGTVTVEIDQHNDPLLSRCQTFNIVPELQSTAATFASGLGPPAADGNPLECAELISSDEELTDTGQLEERPIKQEFDGLFLPNLTERLKAIKKNAMLTDTKPEIIDLCDDTEAQRNFKRERPTNNIITKTKLAWNDQIDLLDSSDDDEDCQARLAQTTSRATPHKCDVRYRNKNVISRLSRMVPGRPGGDLVRGCSGDERDNSTCRTQEEAEILRQIRDLKFTPGSSEVIIKMVNNKLVIYPKDNLNPSDVNIVPETRNLSIDTAPLIQSSHVESKTVNNDKHFVVTVDCTDSFPHQQHFVKELAADNNFIHNRISTHEDSDVINLEVSVETSICIDSTHTSKNTAPVVLRPHEPKLANKDKRGTVADACIPSLIHQQQTFVGNSMSNTDDMAPNNLGLSDTSLGKGLGDTSLDKSTAASKDTSPTIPSSHDFDNRISNIEGIDTINLEPRVEASLSIDSTSTSNIPPEIQILQELVGSTDVDTQPLTYAEQLQEATHLETSIKTSVCASSTSTSKDLTYQNPETVVVYKSLIDSNLSWESSDSFKNMYEPEFEQKLGQTIESVNTEEMNTDLVQVKTCDDAKKLPEGDITPNKSDHVELSNEDDDLDENILLEDVEAENYTIIDEELLLAEDSDKSLKNKEDSILTDKPVDENQPNIQQEVEVTLSENSTTEPHSDVFLKSKERTAISNQTEVSLKTQRMEVLTLSPNKEDTTTNCIQSLSHTFEIEKQSEDFANSNSILNQNVLENQETSEKTVETDIDICKKGGKVFKDHKEFSVDIENLHLCVSSQEATEKVINESFETIQPKRSDEPSQHNRNTENSHTKKTEVLIGSINLQNINKSTCFEDIEVSPEDTTKPKKENEVNTDDQDVGELIQPIKGSTQIHRKEDITENDVETHKKIDTTESENEISTHSQELIQLTNKYTQNHRKESKDITKKYEETDKKSDTTEPENEISTDSLDVGKLCQLMNESPQIHQKDALTKDITETVVETDKKVDTAESENEISTDSQDVGELIQLTNESTQIHRKEAPSKNITEKDVETDKSDTTEPENEINTDSQDVGELDQLMNESTQIYQKDALTKDITNKVVGIDKKTDTTEPENEISIDSQDVGELDHLMNESTQIHQKDALTKDITENVVEIDKKTDTTEPENEISIDSQDVGELDQLMNESTQIHQKDALTKDITEKVVEIDKKTDTTEPENEISTDSQDVGKLDQLMNESTQIHQKDALTKDITEKVVEIDKKTDTTEPENEISTDSQDVGKLDQLMNESTQIHQKDALTDITEKVVEIDKKTDTTEPEVEINTNGQDVRETDHLMNESTQIYQKYALTNNIAENEVETVKITDTTEPKKENEVNIDDQNIEELIQLINETTEMRLKDVHTKDITEKDVVQLINESTEVHLKDLQTKEITEIAVVHELKVPKVNDSVETSNKHTEVLSEEALSDQEEHSARPSEATTDLQNVKELPQVIRSPCESKEIKPQSQQVDATVKKEINNCDATNLKLNTSFLIEGEVNCSEPLQVGEATEKTKEIIGKNIDNKVVESEESVVRPKNLNDTTEICQNNDGTRKSKSSFDADDNQTADLIQTLEHNIINNHYTTNEDNIELREASPVYLEECFVDNTVEISTYECYESNDIELANSHENQVHVDFPADVTEEQDDPKIDLSLTDVHLARDQNTAANASSEQYSPKLSNDNMNLTHDRGIAANVNKDIPKKDHFLPDNILEQQINKSESGSQRYKSIKVQVVNKIESAQSVKSETQVTNAEASISKQTMSGNSTLDGKSETNVQTPQITELVNTQLNYKSRKVNYIFRKKSSENISEEVSDKVGTQISECNNVVVVVENLIPVQSSAIENALPSENVNLEKGSFKNDQISNNSTDLTLDIIDLSGKSKTSTVIFSDESIIKETVEFIIHAIEEEMESLKEVNEYVLDTFRGMDHDEYLSYSPDANELTSEQLRIKTMEETRVRNDPMELLNAMKNLSRSCSEDVLPLASSVQSKSRYDASDNSGLNIDFKPLNLATNNNIGEKETGYNQSTSGSTQHHDGPQESGNVKDTQHEKQSTKGQEHMKEVNKLQLKLPVVPSAYDQSTSGSTQHQDVPQESSIVKNEKKSTRGQGHKKDVNKLQLKPSEVPSAYAQSTSGSTQYQDVPQESGIVKDEKKSTKGQEHMKEVNKLQLKPSEVPSACDQSTGGLTQHQDGPQESSIVKNEKNSTKGQEHMKEVNKLQLKPSEVPSAYDQSTSGLTQHQDGPPESGFVNDTQHEISTKEQEPMKEVNKLQLKPSEVPSAESIASYLPKNGEQMENTSLVVYNAEKGPLQGLRQCLSKFGTDMIPKPDTAFLDILAEEAANKERELINCDIEHGSDSDGMLIDEDSPQECPEVQLEVIDEDSPQECPEVQSEVILGAIENQSEPNEFALQIQNSYQTLCGNKGSSKRKKSPKSLLKNSITIYKANDNSFLPNNIVTVPTDNTQRNCIPNYPKINANLKPNILRKNPKNSMATTTNDKWSYLQPKRIVFSDNSTQRMKTKAEKKQMPTTVQKQNLLNDSDDDVPLDQRVRSRTPSPKKSKTRYGTTDIVVGRQGRNEIGLVEDKREIQRTRGNSGDRLRNANETFSFTEDLAVKNNSLYSEQGVSLGEPLGKRTRRKSGEANKETEKLLPVLKNRRKSGEHFSDNFDTTAIYLKPNNQDSKELDEKDGDTRTAYRSKLRSRSCSGTEYALDNQSIMDPVSQISESIGIRFDVAGTDLEAKELSKGTPSANRTRRRSGAMVDESFDFLIVEDTGSMPEKITVPSKSDITSYVKKLRRKSSQESVTEFGSLLDSAAIITQSGFQIEKKLRNVSPKTKKGAKSSSDTFVQEVLPRVIKHGGRGRGRRRGRGGIPTRPDNVRQDQTASPKANRDIKVKKGEVNLLPHNNSALDTARDIADKNTPCNLTSTRKLVKKPKLKLDLNINTTVSPSINVKAPSEAKEKLLSPLSDPPIPSHITPKQRYKRESKAQSESAITDPTVNTIDAEVTNADLQNKDQTKENPVPIQENSLLVSPKPMSEGKSHPKLRRKSLFSNCKNTVESTTEKLKLKLQQTNPNLLQEGEKIIVEDKNITETDHRLFGSENLNIMDNNVKLSANYAEEIVGLETFTCHKETSTALETAKSPNSVVAKASHHEILSNNVNNTDRKNKESDSKVAINLALSSVKPVQNLETPLIKKGKHLTVTETKLGNTGAIGETQSLKVSEKILVVESEVPKKNPVVKIVPCPETTTRLIPKVLEIKVAPIERITAGTSQRFDPKSLKNTDNVVDASMEDSMLDDLPLSELKNITDYKKMNEKCISVSTVAPHFQPKALKDLNLSRDAPIEVVMQSTQSVETFTQVQHKTEETTVKHMLATHEQPVALVERGNEKTIIHTTSSLDKKLKRKQKEKNAKHLSINDNKHKVEALVEKSSSGQKEENIQPHIKTGIQPSFITENLEEKQNETTAKIPSPKGVLMQNCSDQRDVETNIVEKKIDNKKHKVAVKVDNTIKEQVAKVLGKESIKTPSKSTFKGKVDKQEKIDMKVLPIIGDQSTMPFKQENIKAVSQTFSKKRQLEGRQKKKTRRAVPTSNDHSAASADQREIKTDLQTSLLKPNVGDQQKETTVRTTTATLEKFAIASELPVLEDECSINKTSYSNDFDLFAREAAKHASEDFEGVYFDDSGSVIKNELHIPVDSEVEVTYACTDADKEKEKLEIQDKLRHLLHDNLGNEDLVAFKTTKNKSFERVGFNSKSQEASITKSSKMANVKKVIYKERLIVILDRDSIFKNASPIPEVMTDHNRPKKDSTVQHDTSRETQPGISQKETKNRQETKVKTYVKLTEGHKNKLSDKHSTKINLKQKEFRDAKLSSRGVTKDAALTQNNQHSVATDFNKTSKSTIPSQTRVKDQDNTVKDTSTYLNTDITKIKELPVKKRKSVDTEMIPVQPKKKKKVEKSQKSITDDVKRKPVSKDPLLQPVKGKNMESRTKETASITEKRVEPVSEARDSVKNNKNKPENNSKCKRNPIYSSSEVQKILEGKTDDNIIDIQDKKIENPEVPKDMVTVFTESSINKQVNIKDNSLEYSSSRVDIKSVLSTESQLADDVQHRTSTVRETHVEPTLLSRDEVCDISNMLGSSATKKIATVTSVLEAPKDSTVQHDTSRETQPGISQKETKNRQETKVKTYVKLTEGHKNKLSDKHSTKINLKQKEFRDAKLSSRGVTQDAALTQNNQHSVATDFNKTSKSTIPSQTRVKDQVNTVKDTSTYLNTDITKIKELPVKKRKSVDTEMIPVQPKKKKNVEKSQKSITDDVKRKPVSKDPLLQPVKGKNMESTTKETASITEKRVEPVSEVRDSVKNNKNKPENNSKSKRYPIYSSSEIQKILEGKTDDNNIIDIQDKKFENPEVPKDMVTVFTESSNNKQVNIKDNSLEYSSSRVDIKSVLSTESQLADDVQHRTSTVRETRVEPTLLSRNEVCSNMLGSSATEKIATVTSVLEAPKEHISSVEQQPMKCATTASPQNTTAVIKPKTVDDKLTVQNVYGVGFMDSKANKRHNITSAAGSAMLITDQQPIQNALVTKEYIAGSSLRKSSHQVENLKHHLLPSVLKPSQPSIENVCEKLNVPITTLQVLPKIGKQQTTSEIGQSKNAAEPLSIFERIIDDAKKEPTAQIAQYNEVTVKSRKRKKTEESSSRKIVKVQLVQCTKASERVPKSIQEESLVNQRNIGVSKRKHKSVRVEQMPEQILQSAKKRLVVHETVQLAPGRMDSLQLYNNHNSPGILNQQQVLQKRNDREDPSAKLDRQTNQLISSLDLKDNVPFYELSLITDVTDNLVKDRRSHDVPLHIADNALQDVSFLSQNLNKPLPSIEPKQDQKTSQQLINETFAQYLPQKAPKVQGVSSSNVDQVQFENANLPSDIQNSVEISQILTKSGGSDAEIERSALQKPSNNKSIDNGEQDLYEQMPYHYRNPSPPGPTHVNSISILDFRNPSPPVPTPINCLPALGSRSKSIDLDPYSVGPDTQRPDFLPDFVENKDDVNTLLGQTSNSSQSNIAVATGNSFAQSHIPTAMHGTEANFQPIYENIYPHNLVSSTIYCPEKHIYSNNDLPKLVASSSQAFYDQQIVNTSSGSVSTNVTTCTTSYVQTLPNYMQGLKDDAFCENKSEKQSPSSILPGNVNFTEEYPCASPEQVLPNFNRQETFKASPAASSVPQHSEHTKDTADVNSAVSDHNYIKDVLMNFRREDKHELNQNPTIENEKAITEYDMDDLPTYDLLIEEPSVPVSGIFHHSSAISADGAWSFGVEPDNQNKILTPWGDSKVLVETQPQDFSTYYDDFACLVSSQGSESSDLDKEKMNLNDWLNLSHADMLPDEVHLEELASQDPKKEKKIASPVQEVKTAKVTAKKTPLVKDFIPIRQHSRTKVTAPNTGKTQASKLKKERHIEDDKVSNQSPKANQSQVLPNEAKVDGEPLPQLAPLSGVTTRSAFKKDGRENYVTPQSQSMHKLAVNSQVDALKQKQVTLNGQDLRGKTKPLQVIDPSIPKDVKSSVRSSAPPLIPLQRESISKSPLNKAEELNQNQSDSAKNINYKNNAVVDNGKKLPPEVKTVGKKSSTTTTPENYFPFKTRTMNKTFNEVLRESLKKPSTEEQAIDAKESCVSASLTEDPFDKLMKSPSTQNLKNTEPKSPANNQGRDHVTQQPRSSSYHRPEDDPLVDKPLNVHNKGSPSTQNLKNTEPKSSDDNQARDHVTHQPRSSSYHHPEDDPLVDKPLNVHNKGSSRRDPFPTSRSARSTKWDSNSPPPDLRRKSEPYRSDDGLGTVLFPDLPHKLKSSSSDDTDGSNSVDPDQHKWRDSIDPEWVVLPGQRLFASSTHTGK